MKTKLSILFLPLALTLAVALYLPNWGSNNADWSDAELTTLKSLWLESLPPLPAVPSNRFADNPEAAKLGHRLFFDTRLSKNHAVACATCHQPERMFTDGLAVALGMDIGSRNTQSIVGSAYSPWYFWDGRKDSLWSQALAPLESKVEHGGNRYRYATLLSLDSEYRKLYRQVFGPIPDISTDLAITEVFVNMGKSLEAYQRLMLPGESRFDRYVDQVVNGTTYAPEETLSATEIRGLKLFIGTGQCINCHNGPLFSNFSFHNTGIFPPPGAIPDLGRIEGASLVKEDTFNCLSKYSDDQQHRCDELLFMKEGEELIGAQKTPSLRTLQGTEPYMHAGQIVTLSDVLTHYNNADGAFIGHNEAKPLNLRRDQLVALEAFLRSLSAPIAVEKKWLVPPADLDFDGDKLTNRSSAY